MNSVRFLTTREVAALFRVRPDTVTQWVRRGLLPCASVGRRTRRFDPAEIAKLVRAPRPEGSDQ